MHINKADNADQLDHSDNPDWSNIYHKDNWRIRIVYLVQFNDIFKILKLKSILTGELKHQIAAKKVSDSEGVLLIYM